MYFTSLNLLIRLRTEGWPDAVEAPVANPGGKVACDGCGAAEPEPAEAPGAPPLPPKSRVT